MAAEKTRAVVLKALPYRESSYVVHLFTERHGLVHGIAKGIRSKNSRTRFLERGLLTELVVYVKPHRDLHALGAVQILECFPAVRSDLMRSAVRDAAIEMFLATVTAADPHPDLFDLLAGFLHALETIERPGCFPALLWNFYLTFASLLGFAPNLDTCVVCRSPVPSEGGASLVHRDGGLACPRCRRPGSPSDVLRPWALEGLRALACDASAQVRPPSPAEACRATRALAHYCMYHFGMTAEPRSLVFLEEIASAE